MSPVDDRICDACATVVGPTLRICPRCGGRNFSPAGKAQAISGAPHPLVPQPTPAPAPAAGLTPRPTASTAAPLPLRTKRVWPVIPLMQAHVTRRPMAAMLIATVVVAYLSLVAAGDWVADQRAAAVQPEMERQLTEANAEFRDFIEASLPADAPQSRLVTLIGNRLVASVTPSSAYQYRFHVLRAPIINAFAMPGGDIFITTAMLDAVRDGAQVAATLAHEIEHVERRHGLRQSFRSIGRVVMYGMVLGVFADKSAMDSVKLSVLKYARAQELEADSLGAHLLERSGISRQAMVDLLEFLAAQQGGHLTWLSSHPDSRERARRVATGV